MVVAVVAEGVVAVSVEGAGEGAPSTSTARPANCMSLSLPRLALALILYVKSDSDKKVSQGWGADEGEAERKVEDAAANDAAAEPVTPSADDGGWGVTADNDAWGSAPTGDEAPAAAAPTEAPTGDRERRGRDREVEEDDNTLTLDEYLKQQKEKELELVPKLETRKANEGDDSIWKDAVLVTKKDEDEAAYFVGKVSVPPLLGIPRSDLHILQNKASAPKPRAKKEEKVYLEIDARFERPSRGGRGGRGGDRGGDRGEGRGRGRGRGAGRGRANGNGTATSIVDVGDQTAFPSLS